MKKKVTRYDAEQLGAIEAAKFLAVATEYLLTLGISGETIVALVEMEIKDHQKEQHEQQR